MQIIHVYPNPEYPSAKVCLDDQKWPAVIGKNGVVSQAEKAEGDRATPLGTFTLGLVYIRPEIREQLPINVRQNAITITPELVWCDDPESPYYNQPTARGQLPEGTSAEKMWRDDHLYNIVVDIAYNRKNPVPGKGSAIFMHVARNQENPALTPTWGCIALKQHHLTALLSTLATGAQITIHQSA